MGRLAYELSIETQDEFDQEVLSKLSTELLGRVLRDGIASHVSTPLARIPFTVSLRQLQAFEIGGLIEHAAP